MHGDDVAFSNEHRTEFTHPHLNPVLRVQLSEGPSGPRFGFYEPVAGRGRGRPPGSLRPDCWYRIAGGMAADFNDPGPWVFGEIETDVGTGPQPRGAGSALSNVAKWGEWVAGADERRVVVIQVFHRMRREPVDRSVWLGRFVEAALGRRLRYVPVVVDLFDVGLDPDALRWSLVPALEAVEEWAGLGR